MGGWFLGARRRGSLAETDLAGGSGSVGYAAASRPPLLPGGSRAETVSSSGLRLSADGYERAADQSRPAVQLCGAPGAIQLRSWI